MNDIVQNSEEFQQILKNNSSIELIKKINEWLSTESKKEITNAFKTLELEKFKFMPIFSIEELHKFVYEQALPYLKVMSDGSYMLYRTHKNKVRAFIKNINDMPKLPLFFNDINHETTINVAVMKAK